MADTTGGDYVSFRSLQEARSAEHGAVILEGDDGGQIYAAFPASSVLCTEAALRMLLRDLDAIAWPGNDENSSRVVFERRPIGSGVAGGMGGGLVTGEGWVHRAFTDLGSPTRSARYSEATLRRSRTEPNCVRASVEPWPRPPQLLSPPGDLSRHVDQPAERSAGILCSSVELYERRACAPTSMHRCADVLLASSQPGFGMAPAVLARLQTEATRWLMTDADFP